jgi:hypothetical protein
MLARSGQEGEAAMAFWLALAGAATAAWHDCSAAEGIANPQLTFQNVTSAPEPVVYGGAQSIYKSITNHGGEVANVSATLSQYWYKGMWLRFLKINTDQCKDHPNLCPLAAGATVDVKTAHPPLAWLTPYGWYRSKQVYYGAAGEALGCVDMQFRYCKSTAECELGPAPPTEQTALLV